MRHAPTLATTFLGCHQAAAWDIARKLQAQQPALETKSLYGSVPARDALDAMGEKITQRGHEHEAGVLDALRKHYGTNEVVVIEGGNGEFARARARTDEAMSAGAPVVHQAALTEGLWFGHADFLIRVERPCESWDWSYEPWDAKLARHPRPKFLVQLCLYAEMLDALQGGAPAKVGLMLGPGPSGGTHEAATYPLPAFRSYTARVAANLETFAGAIPDDLTAEPCGACGQCHYANRCASDWEAADHLTFVANITGQQRRRLGEVGITTMAGLAALEEPRPKIRINGATLDRLVQQARLQIRTDAARKTDDTHPPVWEVLDAEPGRGFDRLPAPDPGDVYFDYEGDPLEPGGHEYLCGVLVRDGASHIGTPVPDHEGFRFHAFWAHDKRDEKRPSRS